MSRSHTTRTITITSGKGGVGKTNISVNLALHLATLGYRTCLFDADLGLANINILLGLNPDHDLEDVISNRHSLQDIIIRNYNQIDIIPGSSGVEKMANLEGVQVEQLIRSFSELDAYDFLLFDTSAGVSRSVIAFCLASSEVVLVITPEPTSLTDSYALLKILSLNGFKGKTKIVVNQCQSVSIAKLAYNKFKGAVQKHLAMDVMPLGIIMQDQKVSEAVAAQQALILLYPESNASKYIKNITKNLLKIPPEDLEISSMISFWTKCLQVMKSPFLTVSKKGKKGIEPKPSTGHLQKRPSGLAQETEQKSVPEESKDPGEPAQATQEASEEHLTQLQCPAKGDPTVRILDPSEPGSIAHAEQDIFVLMRKLVDSVSSVSQELQLIRKAIQEQGGNGLEVNRSVDQRSEALRPKPITLDFDAFLRQRGKNVRKEGNE